MSAMQLLRSPFLIESDLGIEKWLTGAIVVENSLPSHPSIKTAAPKAKMAKLGAGAGKDAGADEGAKGGGSLGPYSVSTEFKFVIISSENVTPTWKLLSVSANSSGTLLSGSRTRRMI